MPKSACFRIALERALLTLIFLIQKDFYNNLDWKKKSEVAFKMHHTYSNTGLHKKAWFPRRFILNINVATNKSKSKKIPHF